MDARQKAVNEALWAAIDECSKVEAMAFQQSRCAPSELVVKHLANGEGAVMCKRRLEALLVRVNRGEELEMREPDWHNQNSVKVGNP